jgi:hypothetical protein
MPRVRISERREPCLAQPSFREGLYWTCNFSYPDRKKRPENLSEEISESYNLNWLYYRAHVGDFEFSFSKFSGDPHFRLDEIYAYTNPANWQIEDLAGIEETCPAIFAEFEIENFEVNDVYTLPGTVAIHFDPSAKRSKLEFSGSGSVTQYYRLADAVDLGTDDNGNLGFIQFDNFVVE